MKSKRDPQRHLDSLAEDVLEKCLFEFESSWFKDSNVCIRDFLPPQDHPQFQDILVELIRSHMELSSESNDPPLAQAYFEQFSDVNFDVESKKAIVFEEYRQADSRGEPLSIHALGFRYGLDFSIYSNSKPDGAKLEFPKTGSELGEFRLIGVLGEGAYGRVFLAQQKGLEDRLVVLKLTHQTTMEHRLLARMQHTNIVPIHSVHPIKDMRAICMPLLGIITLSDLLKKEASPSSVLDPAMIRTVMKSKEETVIESICEDRNANKFLERQSFGQGDYLPIRESFASRDGVIGLARKIADGLGYAHQRGIVHGDLKPANVLMGDDGEPIILDFHLGRSTDGTLGRLVGGTIPYMSPEQVQNFENETSAPTPAYDVYATGVLIYELLTRQVPRAQQLSECKELREIAELKSKPFRVRAVSGGELEPDLAAIIEKCLSPDPADRYIDGGELAAELHRCQTFQPLRKTSNGGFANRLGKWAKRNPALSSATAVFSAALILVVLLTAGVLAMSNRLERIAETNSSEARIKAAESLRPTLVAAFDGRTDKSAFAASIGTAESLLKQNGWENFSQMQRSKKTARLDGPQRSKEWMAAAETHFWLAELYRKRPVGFRGNSGTKDPWEVAQEHNQIAQQLWPSACSKQALLKQRNEMEPESDRIIESKLDNFRDRFLWTYLSEVSVGEKMELYRKLTHEDGNHFLSWLLLANACSAQNQSDKAIAYYHVCQSLSPESHIPWLLNGIENLKNNNTVEAIKNLKRAESLAPDDVTVLLNLGLALGKSREFDVALRYYNRAIENGAYQTRVYFLRSRLKRALGDRDGAQADYQRFMATEPLDEISCVTRGVRLQSDQPELAIKDYERALEFNPDSIIARNNLAHVYSELKGDNMTASQFLSDALEIQPNNAVLWATKAVLLARMGDEEKAVLASTKAIELEKSGDIFYRVTGVYAQLSKLDAAHAETALKFLVRAVLYDPVAVLRLRRNDPDIVPLTTHETYKSVFSALAKWNELQKHR